MSDVTSDPLPQRSGASFPVVGIGASAGGVEALQEMLGALREATGMAFVIVQHLAPDHASSLAEILARATKMPVREVSDEPELERDHVYVIPPGRDMRMDGGKLLLLSQQRHAAHRGIDLFFRSLAEDAAHLSIGVVLSGGMSDGTVGLEEIKAAGGVTFAQDESAEHDSMPRSAIASGCVDFVLPPAKIAEELARIARHSYATAKSDAEDDAAAPGYGSIVEIVRGATGVDFTHYKASTLRRRITRRMMLHRLETPGEYEAHLRQTPDEIEELYQDILISVTSFFRDAEAYEAVARDLFPKLVAVCAPGEPVRMWVAGCSSGEEVYSLAMTFAESGGAARLQLFATDVNPRCVEKARAGWYPRSIAQEVSPARLERFFTEEKGGYRVRKALREQCIFSRHNLLTDPPFSRVDFISCRNLLIYLEPVLQQRVMSVFHYALKPHGWLWLGSSESVGAAGSLFDAGDLRHKTFSRQPGGSVPVVPRVMAGPASFTRPELPALRQPGHGALHRDAERVLLKYAPPGVVVSAGLEIVQFQGDTSPFLKPPSGVASYHLLKMLREDLAGGVRDALQRAEAQSAPVRAEGLRVRSNGGFLTLAVEAIPIRASAGGSGGFVVLFDAGGKSAPASGVGSRIGAWWKKMRQRGNGGPPSVRDEEMAHLAHELAATRETLQAVSEQHEAVAEELRSASEEAQSANEEMQSVNEELETSKEEMQATNEELATLNEELAQQNGELNRLTHDLSASEARFRAAVGAVSNLIWTNNAAGMMEGEQPGWGDFTGQMQAEYQGYGWARAVHPDDAQPTIDAWNQAVAEKRRFEFEHRVRRRDGAWRVCSINAVPVLGENGVIREWVGVHTDITEQREAQEAIRRSEALYRAIGESINYGVWVCAPDGRNIYASESFLKLVGLTQEQCSNFGWGEVLHPDDTEGTIAAWQECVRTGGQWDREHRFRGVDGQWHHLLARGMPVKDEHGNVVKWAGINLDISRQKAAEAALRASEERATGIIQSIADGFITLDAQWRITYLSARGAEILAPLQKTTDNVLGKDFWEEFPATVGSEIEECYRRAMREQMPGAIESFYAPLARWFEIRAYPSPAGLTIYFLDITERKAADDSLQAFNRLMVGRELRMIELKQEINALCEKHGQPPAYAVDSEGISEEREAP